MNIVECIKSSCNTIKGYLNTTKGYMETTYSYMRNALGFRNDAQNAKNVAVSAKELALQYRNETQAIKDSIVIPTEATYNKEAIEDIYNDNLTLIVANQTQISYLTKMMKGEYNG